MAMMDANTFNTGPERERGGFHDTDEKIVRHD